MVERNLSKQLVTERQRNISIFPASFEDQVRNRKNMLLWLNHLSQESPGNPDFTPERTTTFLGFGESSSVWEEFSNLLYARRSQPQRDLYWIDKPTNIVPDVQISAMRQKIFDIISKKLTNVEKPKDEPAIPISVLLKKGSTFFGALSAASLILWWTSGTFIFSPFVSILGIVSAPFLFFMGRFFETKS